MEKRKEEKKTTIYYKIEIALKSIKLYEFEIFLEKCKLPISYINTEKASGENTKCYHWQKIRSVAVLQWCESLVIIVIIITLLFVAIFCGMSQKEVYKEKLLLLKVFGVQYNTTVGTDNCAFKKISKYTLI